MATYDGNQGQPSSIVPGDIINFAYSGAVKSITLPKGAYKLECYGARGGRSKTESASGGYSYGEYKVTSASKSLYICVGGCGYSTDNNHRSYNGGGKADGMRYYHCGGGATHIALSTGLLKNVPKTDVIIVAGGSGGTASGDEQLWAGGSGGGTSGGNGYTIYSGTYSYGGSQTSGGTSNSYGSGSYGQGAFINGTYYVGGGGGWYGGGGGYTDYVGGGGGSGYLNPILNNSSMVNGGASGYEDGYVKITALDVTDEPSIYIGASNVAKKVSKMYIGVGGVAKNVKKAYIGVGGVAKLFWSQSNFPKFTYTGNWRWYRDDPELGILELYSSGTLTFDNISSYSSYDACLIGGGAAGHSYEVYDIGDEDTEYFFIGGIGGSGAKMTHVEAQSVSQFSSVTVTIGASNGGTTTLKYGSTSYTAAGGSNTRGGFSYASRYGYSGNGTMGYAGPSGGTAGGAGIGTSANAANSVTGGGGGSNTSNGSNASAVFATSGTFSVASGSSDTITKYLFKNSSYDLYCGGGGGGIGIGSGTLRPTFTKGNGGNGGGGSGAVWFNTSGGSLTCVSGYDVKATSGSKYGAGGGGGSRGGSTQWAGIPGNSAGSGYQGAVFIRFNK